MTLKGYQNTILITTLLQHLRAGAAARGTP